MKLNSFKITIFSWLLVVASSNAAVTIQFSVPFSPGSGVANAFALASGTPANGLFYGIIVDGDGNGFLTTYDPITPSLAPANNNTGSLLGSGGLITDDRLYFAQDLTADNSLLSEGDFATSGGVGGISGLSFDLVGNVNAGDAYGIVWFDPNGVDVGFLTDPSFIIPSDGAIVDHSAPFLGVDSIKPASGIILVPEPSSLLLSAVGLFALLRRKR